jgi:hypothetical protein
VRDFIESEISKVDDMEYLNESIKVLFQGVKGDFHKVKNGGVGQTTILKFLGGGWKQINF